MRLSIISGANSVRRSSKGMRIQTIRDRRKGYRYILLIEFKFVNKHFLGFGLRKSEYFYLSLVDKNKKVFNNYFGV